MLRFLKQVFARLFESQKDQQKCVREAREMHENQTEKQIDKTLKDSFPASDPPAWY